MKIIALIALVALVGCGGNSSAPQSQASLLSDFILTETDYSNATRAYLQNGGGPVVSTYDIVLADLNGDHIPEGLVMMNTPFKTWCNIAGCTLLIFEAKGQDIALNSRIHAIRGPLFIHDTGHPWHSIVTRLDGIGQTARYIELQNNGQGYPKAPFTAANFYGHSPQSGKGYFY